MEHIEHQESDRKKKHQGALCQRLTWKYGSETKEAARNQIRDQQKHTKTYFMIFRYISQPFQ